MHSSNQDSTSTIESPEPLSQQPKGQELRRSLGAKDAASLVVGTVIGTGVFLKAAPMAQSAQSVFWILVAWIASGALSLFGALTYAELASRFPSAGGEYVFLKQAYPRWVAYLYGWTRFWIASPGSIAAYGVAVCHFVGPQFPWVQNHQVMLSIGLIWAVTSLHFLEVTIGARVQVLITFIKFSLLIGLSLSLFLFGEGQAAHLLPPGSGGSGGDFMGAFPGFSHFGMAMLAALWAFDGWNNLPMVSGEIINPKRNIPRALGLGIFAVFGVYVIANLSYFWVLPWEQVITSNSSSHPEAEAVAARAAQTLLGQKASVFLAIAMSISALGAMNGAILTSARVPYALAKDGLFFRFFAKLSPNTGVPLRALFIQSVVASALAASGTFDQLTDLVVFASWIFYGLCTASLFKWRWAEQKSPLALTGEHPNENYRMRGFPVFPAIFLVSTLFLLINTAWTQWRESLLGLAFILLGLPFYFLVSRNRRAA